MLVALAVFLCDVPQTLEHTDSLLIAYGALCMWVKPSWPLTPWVIHCYSVLVEHSEQQWIILTGDRRTDASLDIIISRGMSLAMGLL